MRVQDPTTAAIAEQIAERDQLRADVTRLERALAIVKADHERLDAELKSQAGGKTPTEVFVLLADSDGTLRSSDSPIGVAVTTQEEADRFVREGKIGYSHSYVRVTVFADKDEGLRHLYPRLEKDG